MWWLFRFLKFVLQQRKISVRVRAMCLFFITLPPATQVHTLRKTYAVQALTANERATLAPVAAVHTCAADTASVGVAQSKVNNPRFLAMQHSFCGTLAFFLHAFLQNDTAVGE